MEVTISSVTTTKEALQAWKEKTDQDPFTATRINLEHQIPPIVKIGTSIKKLVNCEVLNLASNMIERPLLWPQLKNLRLLNLSRNNLHTLNGIEHVAKTLEELWVSYNNIFNLKPVESLKNLKVFYISHNNVREWNEFKRLSVPPKLTEISFYGNPLQGTMTEERFRREAAKRLPNLLKLDFMPIMRNASGFQMSSV